jgi:hypothetical protein
MFATCICPQLIKKNGNILPKENEMEFSSHQRHLHQLHKTGTRLHETVKNVPLQIPSAQPPYQLSIHLRPIRMPGVEDVSRNHRGQAVREYGHGEHVSESKEGCMCMCVCVYVCVCVCVKRRKKKKGGRLLPHQVEV